MLTEEQIEAIAHSLYKEDKGQFLDVERDPHILPIYIERVKFVSNKAIAIQAESNRCSFIAVANYIGVRFTAGTDVVSEVYKKLDEIMTAFREHSQEIAIAQQIKTLINQLERYHANQDPTPIYSGAVGEETRKPVCAGDGGGRDYQD